MPRSSLLTPSLGTGIIAASTACAIALGMIATGATKKRDSPRVARASSRGTSHDKVYSPDALPGGRNVTTAYGIIRVFEWGPEDGEKVMIMHGIGTPALGYADMANEFVAKGYRVMTYDYFGRGHSDSPSDLPHDTRLYLTQLLLVLASSPLPWTGTSAFHLVGYSLGGGLAVSIASHYPNLLRSLTIVCPGGLARSSNLALSDRLLYSTGLLPDFLLQFLMRRKLDPGTGGGIEKDVPVEFEGGEGKMPSWEELMRWQLEKNEGFAASYLSTFQHAPIYDQHDKDWKMLAEVLAQRKGNDAPPGLVGGKVCAILGADDIYVRLNEWKEDAERVLGRDAVDLHVLDGGHEIAIANGREVAQHAMESWLENHKGS